MRTLLIVLTAALLVLGGCKSRREEPKRPAPRPARAAVAAPLTRAELAAMAVHPLFAGETVTLRNGAFRRNDPADPLYVQAEQEAFGDLDGDGDTDAVMVLGASGGGSGFFMEIAAIRNDGGQAVHVGSADVGDRVEVRRLRVEKGGTVVADLLEHGPEDGLCCPTQPRTRRFRLEAERLVALDAPPQGGREDSVAMALPE